MIVSHKHRFILVKNKKVGSTSLEVFLSPHCGEEDVLTKISPQVEPHRARNDMGFGNHMAARDIKEIVGPKIWNSYFKFCVERNPWDKVLSHYYMSKNSPYHSRKFKPNFTFDEYLSEGALCLNYPRYTTKGGAIMVDQVVKYENLATELKGIFDRFGIPFDGDLGAQAKGQWRTDRRPYREVLTPAQAETIAKQYQKEIEMHGYEY